MVPTLKVANYMHSSMTHSIFIAFPESKHIEADLE